ncbi:tRNA-Phe hydroxylase [Aureococcus anophagefferens]|nr:tRNA-Phe hydroxylase [Aureococcus anophagefferens]
MHYDCKDNWLCQVAGRKHVLLFPPARSFDVYPYPLDHPMTEFTMVDLEKPDLKRWPAFEQLRRGGVWATLEPGDALFIPRRFTVEQCEPDADNISVNFWFGGYCDNMEDLQDLHGAARGDAARGRCDLATRRILAHRLTEWIAKASLAPVDIEPHEFLTTWAKRGARVFEVPLYRNLRQFAADLVARMAPIVDGEANFFDLLRDMCKDGRLHPGPPAFTVVASGEENRNTPRDALPAKLRGLLRADAARSDSEDDFAGLDG